jgi:predicted short-subunit dehydrogenase-like oxidoreductase (DUF2520 family)
MKSLNIVIAGCGNVAGHFAERFTQHGHQLVQVYHPDNIKASAFAARFKTKCVCNMNEIFAAADVYLIAVKDQAIANIANQLKTEHGIVMHTSGSVEAKVLIKHERYAVFYPLQTFTAGIETSEQEFPLLIECGQKQDESLLTELAASIGLKPFLMNSKQRAEVHLAAVFACNFVNHFIAIAFDLMQSKNYPTNLLMPLIKESIHKLSYISPQQAQTGPAVRHDDLVIEKHIHMLQDDIALKNLYQLITKHIQENQQKD